MIKRKRGEKMALQNKLGITDSFELAQAEERRSKTRALELFEKGLLDTFEAGTFQGLAQIHKYLFDEIYDFAGQLRAVNIAKGNFRFAPVLYLAAALENIGRMPQGTFDEIIVRGNECRPPLPGGKRQKHPALVGRHSEKGTPAGHQLEPGGQGGLSAGDGTQPHPGYRDQGPAAGGPYGPDQRPADVYEGCRCKLSI